MKQADSASREWSGGCSASFQLTTEHCSRNLWFKTKSKLCASLFLGSIACESFSDLQGDRSWLGKGQGRGDDEALKAFDAKSPVNRRESSSGFHRICTFLALRIAVVPGRSWKAKPAQNRKCQNNQCLPPGRWILQYLSVMGDSAHRASHFMRKM